MEDKQISSRTITAIKKETCNKENRCFSSCDRKGLNLGRKTPTTREDSSVNSYDIIHTPLFRRYMLDRELSQQGLSTPKPRNKLESRRIRDKSYYMGVLYRKGYEIRSEIKKISGKVELLISDQSTYTSYKQRAEAQALELKHLQKNLLDYNILDDLYNTDAEIDQVIAECDSIKSKNAREAIEVEELFKLRKRTESLKEELETDISQERYVWDILISTTSLDLTERYGSLKKLDNGLKTSQLQMENELRCLESEKKILEERCTLLNRSHACVQLRKLKVSEKKRDTFMKEQVMNSATNEVEDLHRRKEVYDDVLKCIMKETRRVKSEACQVQNEIEIMSKESNSMGAERLKKLSKLKNKEITMNVFLSSFSYEHAYLLKQHANLQFSIKSLLEKISSGINFDILNSRGDGGRGKSADELKIRNFLKQELSDLMAKEAFEDKLLEEKDNLRKQIASKKTEIDLFGDIESLRLLAEEKRKELFKELEDMSKQKDTWNIIVRDLEKYRDELQNKHQKNEIYVELSKLEKYWQSLEQENFVVKEFLVEAKCRGDYSSIRNSVLENVHYLNEMLIKNL